MFGSSWVFEPERELDVELFDNDRVVLWLQSAGLLDVVLQVEACIVSGFKYKKMKSG